MAATVDVGDEGIAESATKQVFTPYVCRTVTDRGVAHPADVAEASSLAAVPLPPTSYPLWDSIPADLVESSKLSTLQLEGILYACTKHCELLPSGERAGFFIGDGAGVGKGRQISGVIVDNFARGRKRALWLSTSSDLHADASRDLRDLGCHVAVINNVAALDKESRALGLAKEYREGVLFMTYSTLISQVKGRSRLQQVVDWLVYGAGTNGGPTAAGAEGAAAAAALASWDGLIVLDECHKAKNFVPGKEAASTKVASAVIALQERLPRARVLYCSATGVSEVGNMAYMVRMGLWGVGTAFSDFQTFLDSMRRRGVSFMEMLAMEMKAEGKYVARGLSFREAEFTEVEAPLTEQQIRMYDSAVHVWSRVKTQLEAALEVTGGGRDVWKAFWSTQQRFFKLLCVSLKVPTVIAEAREALAAGHCVVIGLQSTGEAAADAVGLEPGPVPGFVSPTKEMLLRFVAQHFPVRRAAAAAPSGGDVAAAAAGGGYGAYGYDEPVPPPLAVDAAAAGAGATAAGGDGEGEEIPACVSMREELMAAVDALHLPANFLDDIIDQLGGPAQVAEMTGRKGRVVRLAGPGTQPSARPKLMYELRAKPDSSEMDSLNITEKDAFLRGTKLVAIISDAASTGISLHASRAAANQRRRRHLTIELPWSADKAIQQLGRSHRSNQVMAPLYKLISTRIGGEKRFAAAVARRLQSLGALTRGDRRAASGVDLSDQNFDSPIGRKSLRRMYEHIMLPTPVLPQGVTLADVFREHPALARTLGPGAGRSGARAANAYRGSETTPGAGAASVTASGVLFDFDDPTVVSLHVEALHEACRRSCELMGVELPTPKPGTAAAAAAGGALDDSAAGAGAGAGSKDGGDGRGMGGDVRRFLNRLLGLRVEAQGLLFAYYAAVLGAEIQKARAEGKYSEGLADVAGTRIQLQSRSIVWVDPLSKLVTTNTEFSVDRGLSWEAAVRRLERERLPGDSSGFRISRRPQGSSYLVLLALQKPGARNLFSIARPNTGAAYFDMDRSDLEAKYLPPVPPGSSEEVELEALWRAAYEAGLRQCSHGPGCRLGPDCPVGRRITTVNVLSGSVVRVWGVLEAVLARREMELPKMERTLRVVRVEWDENEDDEEAEGAEAGAGDGRAAGRRIGGEDDDQLTEARPPASPQVTLSCSSGDGGGEDVAGTAAAKAATADTAAGPSATTVNGSGGDGGRRRRSSGSGGGAADGHGHGDGGATAAARLHVVGVRYPAALLGEVVLALTSASTQATLTQLPGGTIALRAPQAAAAQRPADAPTPVDTRALAQAFRAPRTLMDFFRKPDPASACAVQGGLSGEGGAGSGGALVLQLPLGPRLRTEVAAAVGPVTAAMAAGAATPQAKAAGTAVIKRERDHPSVAVKVEGASAAPPQPVRRVSLDGGAQAAGSGGEVGGATGLSAPAAKRPRMAGLATGLTAGRAAGPKQPQPQPQQVQPAAMGGGGIMAAFARGHQVNARQQQQQQQEQQHQNRNQSQTGKQNHGGAKPTAGPASGGGDTADDDVIDVVSIDCSERPRGGSGATTVSTAAARPTQPDVMMLDSSDNDADDGASGGVQGGGGGEVRITRRRAAIANGGGGADGDGGGRHGPPCGGDDEAVALDELKGDGDDDDDGDAREGDDDEDFVLEEEAEAAEEGDEEEEVVEDDDGGVDWQPTSQRRGGGKSASGVGRGRGSGGGGRATKRGRAVSGRQAATSGRGYCGTGAYGSGGGAAASGGASAATVAKLQGMGFSARQAEKAVWMARGDFQRAVELCLQGM